MTRLQHLFASATIAAVGTLSIAAAPNGTLGFGGAANAKDPYTCMTDDGYGRYRPCSAGYKTANPQWRAGDSCFTDDGYGRYRPCSAGFKSKQSSQTPAAK